MKCGKVDNRKLKIVHCLQDMNVGGAQTLVKEYCEFMDRDRFDISIVCISDCDSPYDKYLREMGIKVFYLNNIVDNNIRCPKFLKRLIRVLARPYIFEDILVQEKPDVIHGHIYMNRLIYRVSKVINAQYYYTVHTDPVRLWYGNKIANKERKATKKLIHNNMQLIVLHNEMRIKVNEIFSIESARIIKNGVNVRKISNAVSKNVLRKEYGILDDNKVIIHIGRFHKVKNHEFLLRIFNEMVKKDEDYKLWLVGDGELRSQIEKKVYDFHLENKVIFWGIRTDTDKLLQMSDMMIFPSFTEGVSLTLIEAQVAKIPIVMSDTINSENIISNIVVAKSLDEGEVKWAEEAMELINRKGNVIYDKLDDWNIENIVKELENVYLRNYRHIKLKQGK